MVLKRRFEVAEETLTIVEEAVRVIAWARTIGGFDYEGKSRKGDPGEPVAVAKNRDAYYRSIERLASSQKVWIALARVRMLCRVHFGDAATKPLDAIRSLHDEIVSTTHMLIRMAGTTAPGAQVEKFERLLYSEVAVMNGKDELAEKVAEAQADIDRTLAPYVLDPFQQLSIWSAFRCRRRDPGQQK